MKKYIVFLFSFIAVLTVLAGKNLLLNPSFEKPYPAADQNSDKAMSWGRWGDWVNRETNWLPTKSGKCLLGYHHWEIAKEACSGIYQDIKTIEPGKYEFSIYLYNDKKKSDMANVKEVKLCFEPYNGGKALYSKTYTVKELYKKSDSWIKLSVSGEIQSNKLRVLVMIFGAVDGKRSGALKFDDAELVKLK